MWVQPLAVVMAVKPRSSPHGGSRRAASVVAQKSNIPSVDSVTQQRPILPNSTSKSTTPSSQMQPLLFSSSSAITPSVRTVNALRIRPIAELGLLSVLFVLSAAFAAVFSVAILCIPTINAMRRLAVAVGKLSNVVSREVPGTLYSLKLSGVEINDLAKQLAALREQISTTGFGKNSE
ncbi:uncharacterized protein LOC125468031 isoform X1 [Pyrus x bretschneideri]|uniref:uncharacterized protein LOC125468031 isoform X1 n=1 Tax=Pyrus x bretschneideri TaxID=225117 RepID=UPI00203096E5|nr:uncharacterized protein LOC125468031 isoform X1 [Pyrus x bretschneideri]